MTKLREDEKAQAITACGRLQSEARAFLRDVVSRNQVKVVATLRNNAIVDSLTNERCIVAEASKRSWICEPTGIGHEVFALLQVRRAEVPKPKTQPKKRSKKR